MTGEFGRGTGWLLIRLFPLFWELSPQRTRTRATLAGKARVTVSQPSCDLAGHLPNPGLQCLAALVTRDQTTLSRTRLVSNNANFSIPGSTSLPTGPELRQEGERETG